MPGEQEVSVARVLDLFGQITPNPYYHETQDYTWKTIVNLGMADQNRRQIYENRKVSLLTALGYPYANLDHLKFFDAVLNWIYYLDDRVDECSGDFRCDPQLQERSISKFLKVIRNPDINFSVKEITGDDSQLAFLKYVVKQAKEMITDEATLDNFMTQLETHITEVAKINAYPKSSSLAEAISVYNVVRVNIGAVPVCNALTRQMVFGRHPEWSNYNPMIFEDMDIKRVEYLNARAVVLFNDLVSYESEAPTCTTLENMVVLLQEKKHCDMVSAMEEVIDMVVQCFKESDEIIQKRIAAGSLSDVLQEYVHGLRTWLLATIQWSVTGVRYFTATTPISECRLALKVSGSKSSLPLSHDRK